jgi:hypothetical protein
VWRPIRRYVDIIIFIKALFSSLFVVSRPALLSVLHRWPWGIFGCTLTHTPHILYPYPQTWVKSWVQHVVPLVYPVPVPAAGTDIFAELWALKRLLGHPNRTIIEWFMIKTMKRLKLIITHLVLVRFGWSKAQIKALLCGNTTDVVPAGYPPWVRVFSGYKCLYHYLYPCNTLALLTSPYYWKTPPPQIKHLVTCTHPLW